MPTDTERLDWLTRRRADFLCQKSGMYEVWVAEHRTPIGIDESPRMAIDAAMRAEAGRKKGC